jgi:MoaA/NifB/PqqE/SkfB family radical SAM enzyme
MIKKIGNDVFKSEYLSMPYYDSICDLYYYANSHKHIYIYGTNFASRQIAKFLMFCGIKISGYIVSQPNMILNLEHPVFVVNSNLNKDDFGVILGLPDRFYNQAISLLWANGFDDFYFVSNNDKIAIAERIKPRNKEDVFIMINIVNNCNLSCSMCCNFSQLSKKDLLSIEIFEKDLIRLSDLFGSDSIFELRVAGGEPLLHPKICDFLCIARRIFPKTFIVIDTNGILIPKCESSFFNICINNNIYIRITKYPTNINYDEIVNILRNYQIKYEIRSENIDQEGIKLQGKFPFNLSGASPIYEFISCCWFNQCCQLRDGKIYTCNVIPNVHIFNQKFNQSLQVSDNDSIDIYKASSYNEIAEFLASPPPFCRYCDVKNRRITGKWKPSDKTINEYVD